MIVGQVAHSIFPAAAPTLSDGVSFYTSLEDDPWFSADSTRISAAVSTRAIFVCSWNPESGDLCGWPPNKCRITCAENDERAKQRPILFCSKFISVTAT